MTSRNKYNTDLSNNLLKQFKNFNQKIWAKVLFMPI